MQNRELEPSEDFARRDIETERPDHEGPFVRGRSDEESGRPVQLVPQLGGFTTQTSKKS